MSHPIPLDTTPIVIPAATGTKSVPVQQFIPHPPSKPDVRTA